MMNIMKMVSPEHQETHQDDEFVNSMNDLELHTWSSFVDIMKNFLSNQLVENYKE